MRDIDNIGAALEQLETGLKLIVDLEFMESIGEGARNMVRAGVIQHMEMVYELSWKAMQRWIGRNLSEDELTGQYSRRELFRLAARVRLIADPMVWFKFHEVRNITSHTYRRETADEVLLEAPALASQARALIGTLTVLGADDSD